MSSYSMSDAQLRQALAEIDRNQADIRMVLAQQIGTRMLSAPQAEATHKDRYLPALTLIAAVVALAVVVASAVVAVKLVGV